MSDHWKFESVEDKEVPNEAQDARDEVLVKWLARFHIREEGGGHEQDTNQLKEVHLSEQTTTQRRG